MNLTSLPNIHIEQEYHTPEEKKEFLEKQAQRMRENPTEGEKLFKNFCDKYKIPYTIQKPVMIGYKGFILDFEIITKDNPKLHNSKKRKIAVEIDGEYHKTKEQKEKDDARTKTLKGNQYSVIRFTNDEVKDENRIIQKFLLFLPNIKETTLLKKFSKLNDSIILKEKDSVKELMYLKERYESLKTKYEKLREWALQVQPMLNSIYQSCPVNRNVVDFF